MLWGNTAYCVKLIGEDLSRYSNKIESVGLGKYPYYRYLIENVTSTDVRITNISQSLPHKMTENSWYEEMTSLSPYMYSDFGPIDGYISETVQDRR